MSNIIGQIISISNGIGRRRRFLKKRNMLNAKMEKTWIAIQAELRSALVSSFHISEKDVMNFPHYLKINFDEISKKLTPDIIENFSVIIEKMRNIESFLSGMMAGIDAHQKELGNYSGLIYKNTYDSPCGGEHDDCDMIVVAKSDISWQIEHLGEIAGKVMHTFTVDSSTVKSVGLDRDVVAISICHS